MNSLNHITNIDAISSSTNSAYFSNTTSNPPDTSFIKLNIGSLNCRGLSKTSATSTRDHFIRYLRTRSLDLLALQETHASCSSLQALFHSQFQATASLWSPHCGLVSFSSDIAFSDTVISVCGRIISTTISHSSDAFDPFTATVVYFPASRPERFTFLSNLLSDYDFVFAPSPVRSVILGDFNYTYSNSSTYRNRQAPAAWLKYIDDHFINGITAPGASPSITFQRGTSQSCIDYVFLYADLTSAVQFDHCHTTFVQPAWSDHFLLSCPLRLYPPTDSSSASSVGQGLWRAHPRLASNSLFRRQLSDALSRCVHSLDGALSAAQKWELLKQTTATVAKSFSRRQAQTLSSAEDLLHRKRSGIQHKLDLDPSLRPTLQPLLSVVEEQLAALQQNHVENLALRSGIRWREKGETSAGFLKRTVSSRASRKLIPPLIHPATQRLCSSKEEMLDAAASYYGNLYSPDAIDMAAVNDLLDAIPRSARLSASDAQSLLDPITFEDLVEAFSRAPAKSSPGMDSLPYQLVRLIVLHPECREIALATFNNALSFSDIPPSWLESCITLLPKKGALDLLQNWRPISLINTDAKVFTRIVSGRMIDG
ncbi:hypothetical protein [Parasitella parasitica]|uniref:Endonuclease/exonuclease/phosphatase domain-containing protein n=1 Tax=Parasitella parasitica TaxID=35722 RepID=A0A0B7NED4_9FUNG|nr:hypothetical protein [Parasitella parasitica]